MTPRKSQPGKKTDAARLRRQAEAQWSERKKKTGPLPAAQADLQRLVHELQVHQIELQMQNEELMQARAETEEALRRYSDLYDFAPAGYFTLTRDGAIRQVNLSGARLLGLARKKLIKRRFGLFVSVESRQTFTTFLDRVFECRGEQACEVVLRREGKEPCWAHIEASCVEGEDECRAVVVDITERENAQAAQRETEQYFRTVVETINEGLSTFDENGIFTYVNDRFCEMLGYSRAELIGSSHLKVIPQAYQEQHKQIVEARRRGEVGVYETVFKRKDNREVPVILAGSPILDPDGNYQGTVGACIDISERVRAQQALRESEERHKLLAEAVSDYVYSAKLFPDGSVETEWITGAFEAITGYSFEGLVEKGPGYASIIAQEDLETFVREYVPKIQHLETVVSEYRITRKDGEQRWLQDTIKPLSAQPEHGYARAIGAVRDITEHVLADKEINESRMLLEKTFASLDQAVFVVAVKDRTVLACNPAAERIFGYLGDELVGRTTEFMYPDRTIYEHYPKLVVPALNANGIYNSEMQLRRKDGGLFHAEVTDTEVLDDDGRRTRVVSVIRDITERKENELRVRTSEQNLSMIFNTMDEGVALNEIVQDDNGAMVDYRILAVNKAFCDISGLRESEVVGQVASKVYGYTSEYLKEFWHEHRQKHATARIEMSSPISDKILSVSTSPFVADRFVTSFFDITEQVRAKQELQENNQFINSLLENSPVSIYLADAQNRISLVNKRWESNTGRVRAEVLGRTLDQFFPAEVAGKFAADNQKVIETGAPIELEEEIDSRSFLTVKFPVREKQGIIKAVGGISVDITEQKKSERALQDAKEFAENLIETANTIVVGLDTQGHVTILNRAAEIITGYSRSELQGKNWFEIVTPKDRYPQVWDEFNNLLKGKLPRQFENPILTKAGEERYIIWQNSEMHAYGKIVGTLSFGLDSTERMRAEQALQQAEQRYRLLFENVGEGIGLTDSEEQYIFANPAAESIFGVPPGGLVGRNLREFILPEQHSLLQEQTRLRREGVKSVYQIEIARRDGGKRALLVTAAPWVGSQGEFLGTFAVFRDMTELIRAQQEITALLDSVTDQREELRMLAARISQAAETERRMIADELHDQVGQSLTAMNINLNILRGELPESDSEQVRRVDDTLQLVDQTAERIRDLMTQLRPSVLDDYGLFPALEVAAEQFTARTGIPVSVSRQPARAEIPRLSANEETALFRIAQEALVNCARHAGASRIKITLKTLKHKLRLIVADDGQGFDPEDSDRSKENGGWGLRIMHERALAVGARLVVDSCPGEGTTVTVELKS